MQIRENSGLPQNKEKIMRKKFSIFLVVLLLATLCAVCIACEDDEENGADEGSWTVLSDNKLWTIMTLELSFEEDGVFRVRNGEEVWIEGKYSFEGTPGQSTLTLSRADIAIPGVEKDGAKEYEPTDGVYKIEFDHGSGQMSQFSFMPPQDGSLPGEETDQTENNA